MSDIKMSECCTCGTKWQAGQDGRHSCSSKLSKDNQALVEQNKALKDALKATCDETMTVAGHPDFAFDGRINSMYEVALESSKALKDN